MSAIFAVIFLFVVRIILPAVILLALGDLYQRYEHKISRDMRGKLQHAH